MSGLRTMADLLARHASRVAIAQLTPTRPRQAPPGQGALRLEPEAPEPARRAPSKPLQIDCHTRGPGYELRVAGHTAVSVRPAPSGDGWIVRTIGATHDSPPMSAGAAEALAWRVARIAAAQT